MNQRQKQRIDTQEKILLAALETFATVGFSEASSYKIARKANIQQGLLTYHFPNKEILWKAVTEHLFSRVRAEVPDCLDHQGNSSADRARRWIGHFVRFAARNPVLMRFMIENNVSHDERLDWIVPRYVQPGFEVFCRHFPKIDASEQPHAFYIFLGASSAIFASRLEFEKLCGFDPTDEKRVDDHVRIMTHLMLNYSSSGTDRVAVSAASFEDLKSGKQVVPTHRRQ
ncbi:MAG: TetR/AcrR family transcriptional regulator [Verrucomicrobiota bacterium]